MPSREEYDETLDLLAKLLKRKPMTAREIAGALGCCRPAAYQRLRALQNRGVVVDETPTKERKTGPKAVAYRIRQP